MPTKHHHFLYGHELNVLPWHGITAENPPLTIVERWWQRHHWPSLALWGLFLLTVMVVWGSSRSQWLSTIGHVGIGVVALPCGMLGRRACNHRSHQVAVTSILLLIEAYASVRLVG